MSFVSALPAALPRFHITALSKSSPDVAFGREYAALLVETSADVAHTYDTYTLIRRHTDHGVGYDTHRVADLRDVALSHEYTTLLVKAPADIARPRDAYTLIRRHIDHGVGREEYKLVKRHADHGVGREGYGAKGPVVQLKCVVTNAVYGGLRICHKKEGDPLDFETLWYIFLTLRRVDEFLQEIREIDPFAPWDYP